MSQLTDDILSRIDIVDIVSKYVPLKRAGSNFSGLSPFQKEKTPSFMVSPQKQIFKDFSSWLGGNAITFVMEIEKIDFRDAIKILAEEARVDLSKYQQNPEQHIIAQDEKEKIKRIHSLTQQFFVAQLEKNTQAQEYLRGKRKLSPETQKQFGIGYAPDSHYDLIQFLKSKGFSDQDIIDASLAKKWQSGDSYAFFRHRITFPIHDHMGNVIAFGARVINPEDQPKYLNSADHKGYDKSKTLYGLDKAKHTIKEFQSLIIVEWYMDVIALHRLWFPIGLATCGTAMTHEHLKTIKRYTDTVYLLFDTDNAGTQASIRALSICYSHEIYPKMLTLPDDCKDVDDLANKEDWKEIFAQAINKAQDGFLHTFLTSKKTEDWTSPIGRQKVINTMFELIMAITSSASIQKHYIEVLADQLGMHSNVIEAQYRDFRNKNKFIAQKHHKEQEQKKSYQPNRELLFAALLYKDFYTAYVENRELRQGFITFIETMMTNLGIDHTCNIILHDPSRQNELNELQVRREKELDMLNSEEDKLEFIKKSIRPIIHGYINHILKDKKIDHDKKLQLQKNMKSAKL